MKKLLHIVGSPRKEVSRSEIIAAKFIEEYRKVNPEAEIDTLNLWETNIPHFDGDKAAAKLAVFGGAPLDGALQTAWGLVTQTADRFTSADEYLITVPVWNGGIPWILKNYIDVITQPGITFGFGADGYFPLLKEKKAAVIYASGVYSPTLPAAYGVDFTMSYMDWWLKFIGVDQVYPIEYLSNLFSQSGGEYTAASLKKAGEVAREYFSA